MLVTISSGAHWRNVDIPPGADQFAHIFDPESPEDVPHDAWNFITYMSALGGCESPLILYRPETIESPDWIAPVEPHSARHFGPEDDHVEVMMSDWKQIVETATGQKVEIR